MFEFVKKLMFARQLTFDRGKMQVLNQRVVVIPSCVFMYMLKEGGSFEEAANYIYLSTKLSVKEKFGVGIEKEYGLKGKQKIDWLRDVNDLVGLGLLTISDYDPIKKRGIGVVTDAPIADNILKNYGKSDKPVDHDIRGFIAGGCSSAFASDVECVETECLAMGDNRCKFLAKPLEEFRDVTDPLIQFQLPQLFKKEDLHE